MKKLYTAILLLLVGYSQLSAQCTLSGASTDATCFGSCNGSIMLVGSGGAPPYQYSNNGGVSWQTTGNFDSLCTGAYSCIMRDAAACTSSVLTYSIAEPASFTMALTSGNNGTCGTDSGYIQIFVSGGTPPYTYLLDSASATGGGSPFTFYGLYPGTYTVIVTDANGCQNYATSNVPVSSSAGPDFTYSVTNANCPPGNDGVIAMTASGGTAPYTYSIDGLTFQSSSIFSGLSSGIYTAVVQDNTGCLSYVQTIQVSENNSINVTYTTTDATCAGNDGSITVSASGGTGPYEYTISGDSAFQSSPTFSNLSPGYYQIEVRDANGCTKTDSTGIAVIQSPSITVTYGSATCGQADGLLTVYVMNMVPPIDYSIDGGVTYVSGGITFTFDSLAAGMYVITARDSNSCAMTATGYVYGDSSACDSVWPGDANHDGIANNQDMLNIGVAYGSYGMNRPVMGNNWAAHYATNWFQYFASGVDYKHANCNGDSLVDAMDTVAILQNYGFTHSKTSPVSSTLLTDPVMKIEIQQDSVFSGDTVTALIKLGDVGTDVSDLYGVAFTINYSSLQVKGGTMELILSPSWLGTPGSDLLSICKPLPAMERTEVAVTRIDQSNRTGNGVVATCRFISEDNISGRTTQNLVLSITNIKAISANETDVPLQSSADSAAVGISKNDLKSLEFNVYPIPAKDWLAISFEQVFTGTADLFTLTGSKVLTVTINGKETILNTSFVPTGMYLLKIRNEKDNSVRKVVVSH